MRNLRFSAIVAIFSLIILAILMGIVVAVSSVGFIAKVAILLTLFPLAVFAILNQASIEKNAVSLMALVLTWLILHACTPTYLTLKVGYIPDLSPYRLLGWFIIAVLVYRWLSSRQFRLSFYHRVADLSPIFGLLVAILIWSIFCSLMGENPLFSLSQVSKTFFFSLILLVLSALAIRSKDDIDRILFVAILCAFFATAIGIVEWKHKENLFLSLFPSDPERMSEMQWILADRFRDGVYRASSLFKHPLVFGEYLAMTLPFCLYFIIDGRRAVIRYCSLLGIFLIPIGIYISHTRSSLIASIVGVIVFFIARGIGRSKAKSGRVLVIAAIAIVGFILTIMIFLLTKDIFQGRTQAERGSSAARIVMIDRGLSLISSSPIVGYGPGTSASKIGKLGVSSGITIDNYYLSVALENGVPGLLLYLGILIVPFRQLFRSNPDRAGLISALLASLVVYALIRSILSLTYNQDYCVLVIALLLLANRLPDKAPASTEVDFKIGRSIISSKELKKLHFREEGML